MGLLDKLKSLLGSDDRQTPRRQGGSANVTVEHEPDPDPEPATESEAAVKGTGGADDHTADADAGVDTTPQAGSTAGADSTDGAAADAGPGTGAEMEAGEKPAEPDESQHEGGEPSEPAAEVKEEESGEGSDEPVDSINGIGPTYAERLEAAGIETVGDLAVADLGTVADAAEAPESRVTGWLEQANAR